MPKTIKLELVTPERLTLSREVDELVLPGSEGSFGVLPGHMPLMAALRPGMLKFKAQNAETVYAIGGGYAQITPSQVVVLADTAEPAEDIDVAAAQQARRKALAQLKQGLKGADLEAAEISLRKALAELKVADLLRRSPTGGAPRPRV